MKKTKLALVLLLSLMIMPGLCLGAEYYVSEAGSGAHDGSAGGAFTLVEALDFAESRLDEEITYLIASGNYNMAYGNSWNHNIPERSTWVTWKAQEGHSPVFRRIVVDDYSNDIRESTDVSFRFDGFTVSPEPGDRWAVMVGRGAKRFEFHNLRLISPGEIGYAFYLWSPEDVLIDNFTTSGPQDAEYFFGFGVLASGNNISILNSEITNCNMGIQTRASNVLIKGNHIHKIYSDGIFFSGENITIENNEIHNLRVKDGSIAHTDLMQASANSGTTNVIMRGNKLYDSDGQIGWINPVNGRNFLVENNLFYNVYGSWDNENSGRSIFGGIENFIFRNNTMIGVCQPSNVTGYVEFSRNIVSTVWIDESNARVTKEEFNFINKMGDGMHAESGNVPFIWDGSSILVSDWDSRRNFYNPEFFKVFVNVPQFGDMVANKTKEFSNVTLGVDAEGHPMLTSAEFDFNTQYVFPKYRVKVLEGKEHIDPRFQDPNLQNMPVHRVEGNTIYIRSDNKVINTGVTLKIEISYTTSSETKVYYADPDSNFEVGDVIDYEGEISEGISHTIVSVGEDANGKYFEITPPLGEKARWNNCISNWKKNTNVKRDFTPKADSIICNGSHPGSQSGVAWAGAFNVDGTMKGSDVDDSDIWDDYDGTDDHIEELSVEGSALVCYNNVIKKGQNDTTTIQVNMKEPGNLSVKIYDSKGKEIIVVWGGHKDAGFHTFPWAGVNSEGSKVGSGIYMVNMKIGNNSETKKIAIIR